MQDVGPSHLAPAGEDIEPQQALQPAETLKNAVLAGCWNEAVNCVDHVPRLPNKTDLILLLRSQKFLEEMVKDDLGSALCCLR